MQAVILDDSSTHYCSVNLGLDGHASAPTEEEEDAEEAAEVYKVERVEVKKWDNGMDQHVAPPIPKVLSKEERRSNESGYVR